MAIMSTYSSQLIAISSICTYDIYKTYINTAATGQQLMRINYIGMTLFALFMAGFSTALYYIGVSMGYLYLLMGVIISSAVVPATLTLIWDGQSWAAATFAPILGLTCSIVGWLVTTHVTHGAFSVETTGSNTPMLVGNIVALLSPLVFVPILTFLPPFKPQSYDWQSMLAIRTVDDQESIRDAAHIDPEVVVPRNGSRDARSTEATSSSSAAADEKANLDKAAKIARYLCVGLTLAFLILWPMPLYGTGYVFSKSFFTGWVVVGILWLFVSCGMVVFLPVFESRRTIVRTSRAMFSDLLGLGRRPAVEVTHGRSMAGDATPPEGEYTETVTEKK